jgi:hypothetical protein
MTKNKAQKIRNLRWLRRRVKALNSLAQRQAKKEDKNAEG